MVISGEACEKGERHLIKMQEKNLIMLRNSHEKRPWIPSNVESSPQTVGQGFLGSLGPVKVFSLIRNITISNILTFYMLFIKLHQFDLKDCILHKVTLFSYFSPTTWR